MGGNQIPDGYSEYGTIKLLFQAKSTTQVTLLSHLLPLSPWFLEYLG